MTYLIPSNLPLAPDTRKRPPQSGFVQTGFEEILLTNSNLLEEDFGLADCGESRVPHRPANLVAWRRWNLWFVSGQSCPRETEVSQPLLGLPV